MWLDKKLNDKKWTSEHNLLQEGETEVTDIKMNCMCSQAS